VTWTGLDRIVVAIPEMEDDRSKPRIPREMRALNPGLLPFVRCVDWFSGTRGYYLRSAARTGLVAPRGASFRPAVRRGSLEPFGCY